MNTLRKQKISLVVTALVLCISVVAYFGANEGSAWFAKNSDVSAEGMQVMFKVSPNMVIADKPEDMGGADSELAAGFLIEFDESAGRNNMYPATRDEEIGGTFLKYPINTYDIDFDTGLPINEDTELDFMPVDASLESVYYVEYVVYIAASNAPIVANKFYAEILLPDQQVDNSHKSACVDLYLEEATSKGYRGTLNLGAAVDGNGSVVNFSEGEFTIPENTDGSVKIILRCYFDGAMTDENGIAYVNSKTVSISGVRFGVSFVAE